MNIKSIIIVIITSILIGAAIVNLPKFLHQSPLTSNLTLPTSKTTPTTSTPTPIPTKPPVIINESSNLEIELEQIEIPDFKQDFETLKSELQ